MISLYGVVQTNSMGVVCFSGCFQFARIGCGMAPIKVPLQTVGRGSLIETVVSQRNTS